MPTPQGIQTVTLHGRFVEPDLFGTPLVGSVTFTPNVSMVTFPVENTLMSGTETATLNGNGEFTIDLPCTDTPGQNPNGWTYTVTEKLIGVRGRTYNILLPYTVAVVELSDITPTDAAPTFLPVVGPQGPAGIVTSVNGYSQASINLTAADVQALGLTGDQTATGTKTLERLRLTDATDLTLASTLHAFQIGLDANLNLRMDSNEIQALSNGAVSPLAINADGGGINMFTSRAGGSTTDTLAVRGRVTTNGIDSSVTPTLPENLTRKDYVDGLDVNNVKLTGVQSVGGAKTFTSDLFVTGSRLGVGITSSLLGRVHVKSVVDEIGIQVDQTTITGGQPHVGTTGFDTNSASFVTKVAADSVNRLAVRSSGNIEFGSGAGARDVTLYRSGVGLLSTTGQFTSDLAAPTAAAHLTRKDYVDGNFLTLATTQAVTGLKNWEHATGSNFLVTSRIAGNANPRWAARADGELRWGDGTASTDTNLYREDANTLASLGIFRSYRSSVGNAFSARVVGDTASRWFVNSDGSMNWGPGGSSSTDVSLGRVAAGALAAGGTFVAQVETTTSATPGTNFTTTSFSGRKTCGVCTVHVTLSYTGSTITADAGGNITDTLCFTLPAGYRPAATAVEPFDKSGTAMGDVVILTDGTCTLKTLSATATIASGNSITFNATFVL